MIDTWTTKKAMVTGSGGMVAAQHVTAAEAGAAVLERGGNAMDAAITTALVLSVVEPWLSGIGGGGFILHRNGATGETQALDFNMVSPAAIDPADYPLVEGHDGDWFNWPAVKDDRNLIGPRSICVPGAIAGFAEALARHGTISFAEALAPAIEEAEKGLRVDWFTELALTIDAPNLATDPTSAAIYLVDGKPPRLPEGKASCRLPLGNKAKTLKRLAEAGGQDFYTGEIGRALVEDFAAMGCLITADDLAAYRPRWMTPLSIAYRDAKIHAMPGLSGGPAFAGALEALQAGDAFKNRPGEPPKGRHYAAYADAVRSAYAHRLTQAGHASSAKADPGCTSHLSVVDAAGNVVALTNTLLSRFGSKVTSPATGITMNNGVMWFDPRPGQPNGIAPGVKPLANMCPLIADTADGATIAVGAAGGRQIFPALVQILSFCIDFDMDIGAALSQPRIDASAPKIRVDRRVTPEAAGMIAARHDVEVVDDVLYPVQFAIPSAVTRHADGRVDGMVHPNHPWSAAVAADTKSSEAT